MINKKDGDSFNIEYCFFGNGKTLDKANLSKYFPRAVVSNNLIIGGDARNFGTKNLYPTSIKQLDFLNSEKGDHRPAADNQFLKKGFEGKQIGANLDPSTVGG